MSQFSRPLIEERNERIVHLYKTGHSRAYIIRELKVTRGMIAGALRRAGVKGRAGRPKGAPARKPQPQAHRVETARAPRRFTLPKPSERKSDGGAPENPRTQGSRRLTTLLEERTAAILAAVERRLAAEGVSA